MVNEDRESERLSDFLQVTELQNQDRKSDQSWARVCSTTHDNVKGLLPVWGQIFFLLLLPSFLPSLFLVGNKHTGNRPLVLASPAVCASVSQPSPLILPSDASRVSPPPCPRPGAGSSALDASAHPPGGTAGARWGSQGLERTGGRGEAWDGVDRRRAASEKSETSPRKAAGVPTNNLPAHPSGTCRLCPSPPAPVSLHRSTPSALAWHRPGEKLQDGVSWLSVQASDPPFKVYVT